MAKRRGVTPTAENPTDHAQMSEARSQVLTRGTFDSKRYEYDDRFRPASDLSVHSVHTVPELVALLEKDKSIDIDARVLGVHRGDVEARIGRIQGREKFLEAYKIGNRKKSMREAADVFGSSEMTLSAGKLGDIYAPLLGGPFHKQLYYYDYLRMHALAFQFKNHNPFARHHVRMISDFTLGRGYRVDCDDPKAMAYWKMFETANNLPKLMEDASEEISTYGEIMLWWLPDFQTRITYRVGPGQEPPKGSIPRIRLIDPSVIWEVVTYPEDISRVLFYQWVAPTQYQLYTGKDGGSHVPGSKFIFQQIPGDQVQHVRINCASNEKRGRSDLFPNFGFMKRLVDSIDYQIAADQKNAAWAIDTTIKGGARDLDDYVSDQQSQGSIAPAGSEFVHTDKVERKYNSNSSGSGSRASPSFEWTLSCVAAGSGFPMSYWNTHLSGAQARASAIVSTEPVAKMLERRQLVYERTLLAAWERFFKIIGYTPTSDPEVTFPEIITADRSSKIKDIGIADEMGYIKKSRAASMVAKELGVTNYDYDDEKKEIEAETPEPSLIPSPLTAPGAVDQSASALPSDERKDIKDDSRS